MNFQQHIPFISIFVPMITAMIIPILKKEKAARKITFVSLSTIIALSAILVFYLHNFTEGFFTYKLGRFPAPWGNELRCGMLEATMSLTFGIVMLLSICGGLKGITKDIKDSKKYSYYLMLNLLMSSLLVMAYTNDIFTAYVFIEISTVTACSIVVARESGETIRATIKYFIMSSIGSGLYLMAVAILYDLTGHVLMANMHESIQMLVTTGQYHLPLTITFILIVVALGVKSALFPFHSWLPDAHSSATSSSSAILSGLVLKGYIILLIKIIYRVYGIEVIRTLNVLPIVLFLGLAAMIYGSVCALRQRDLKKVIAYSSIAQIGYIYMGIGLGTSAGMAAACFHIIVHAFTKAMLFISSGNLIHACGSNKIKDMNGIGFKCLLSGVAFCFGGLSMIGMPLFAGFISKMLFASAAFEESRNIMFIVMTTLAVSAFLNALYYIPIMIKIFNTKSISSGTQKLIQVSRDKWGYISIMLFMAANIYLGLSAMPIINAISIGIDSLM